MTHSQRRITVAARLIHNAYSETDWAEASIDDAVYAESVTKRASEALGGTTEDAEIIRGHRKISLAHNAALAKTWALVAPLGDTSYGIDPEVVPHAVAGYIEALKADQPVIEVTDDMVNALALDLYGPAVVYDREKVRAALANALQTR